MKFLRLSMRNFRPFYGEHDLDLSTPGESSLIVVFGENMRGKTALLNAIRWCLYGRVFSRTGQLVPIFSSSGTDEQLLNSVAEEQGSFEVEVVLHFEHNGQAHTLRRVASASDRVAAELGCKLEKFLQVDGGAVAEADIDDRIGQILNEDVSRFSLFDGEMLNEYEKLLADDEEEVRAVRTAIEKILGLPALTHGKVHLESVLAEAEKDLNREVRKAGKYKAAADRFEALEDEVRAKTREHQTLKEHLRQAEENLSRARKDLREIQQFNSIFDSMSLLEGQIDSATAALEKSQSKVQDVLSKQWWVPLTNRISKVRGELDQRVEDEVEIQGHLAEHRLLLRSVDGRECLVCGNSLSEHTVSSMRQKALGLQNDVARAATAQEMEKVLAARRLVAQLDDGRWREVIASSAADTMQYATELTEKKAKVEDLRRELGGISKGDQQKKMRVFESAEADCQRLRPEVMRAESDLGTAVAEKDKESAKMGRFEGVDPEIRGRFVLAGLLVRSFEAAIDDFRDRAREIVSGEADTIFQSLISEHDYTGLRITKNYGLRILDSRGNQLPGRSAGAEHIVALSLIGGLNRSAVGGDAPLVMDTNFGRLDKSHRQNVVSFVAKLDQQVILLVHSGEIDEDDLDQYDVQCARKYRIEKRSEWQSEVVPV
jgi:DNA sulfur modification protein DndD